MADQLFEQGAAAPTCKTLHDLLSPDGAYRLSKFVWLGGSRWAWMPVPRWRAGADAGAVGSVKPQWGRPVGECECASAPAVLGMCPCTVPVGLLSPDGAHQLARSSGWRGQGWEWVPVREDAGLAVVLAAWVEPVPPSLGMALVTREGQLGCSVLMPERGVCLDLTDDEAAALGVMLVHRRRARGTRLAPKASLRVQVLDDAEPARGACGCGRGGCAGA